MFRILIRNYGNNIQRNTDRCIWSLFMRSPLRKMAKCTMENVSVSGAVLRSRSPASFRLVQRCQRKCTYIKYMHTYLRSTALRVLLYRYVVVCIYVKSDTNGIPVFVRCPLGVGLCGGVSRLLYVYIRISRSVLCNFWIPPPRHRPPAILSAAFIEPRDAQQLFLILKIIDSYDKMSAFGIGYSCSGWYGRAFRVAL